MTLHALNHQQAHARIRSEPNDRIRIELPENPTSGFRWQIDNPPSFCELIEDSYTRSDYKPGSDSLRVLVLKVKSIGKAHIRLRCVQAWNPDLPPQGEFDFSVECI